MTDRKIMEQALADLNGATELLRTRLAQPEQEPVQFKCTVIDDAHPNGIPLEQWAKPPQRKPLTKEQCLHLEVHPLMTIEQVVRVVEAAHGIKGDA